ncbi:hypothetical protein KP509_29G022000 [Ceratopteris richardii]|uniref:Uncharacterized protein n=1 Tax=Ceratopteris richardii TaxID=49495 RepID=A0A8T2R598_CERRI|nr:hypothetical protein KP509_29G022000 [Ceratopteris richardii]
MAFSKTSLHRVVKKGMHPCFKEYFKAVFHHSTTRGEHECQLEYQLNDSTSLYIKLDFISQFVNIFGTLHRI